MKKNILKILLAVIIISNCGILTATAAADDKKPANAGNATKTYTESVIPKPSTLPGPASKEARKVLTQGVLPKLAVLLIGSTAALSLLFLIVAGVRFAMVYGNEEAAQSAKKQVIYSIVGLIVALMSYTIVTIVTNFNYEEGAPPATTQPILKGTEGSKEKPIDPKSMES